MSLCLTATLRIVRYRGEFRPQSSFSAYIDVILAIVFGRTPTCPDAATDFCRSAAYWAARLG